jgi:outer membrane lipoprotein-sorting protein
MISTLKTHTRALALVIAAATAAGATLLAPVAASASTTQAVAVTDVLRSGQSLKAGQYIRSKNGVYTFRMQADGNAVLIKGRTALWSTATNKKGSVLVMQKDGNLVVVHGRTKVWATNGSTGAALAVQNDNNLVIYNSRGKAVWYKNMVIETLGVNRVLKPYQLLISRNRIYRLNMQSDGNLVLVKNNKTVLWNSKTGRNPGAFAIMQGDGNLVLYRADKSVLWHTATAPNPGSVLVMQGDGNAVIIHGRTKIWATNTAGR